MLCLSFRSERVHIMCQRFESQVHFVLMFKYQQVAFGAPLIYQDSEAVADIH